MARKAKQSAVQGIDSKSYAYPSFWGLTGKPWSKLESVSEEQARLMGRYTKLGAERLALMDELEYQRHQYHEQELDAVRRDEDPPEPQYIKATEEAIARTDKKLKALKEVAVRVDREYHAAMQELRGNEELTQKLEAQGKQHLDAYLSLVAEAEQQRDRMGVFLGISRFIAGMQEEFGPPPNDFASRPWYQQNVAWPSDPERDPTITSQTAASIL